MRTCRAAVVVGVNRPIEVRDVTIPQLDPGAALARVDAGTLCGTDVHRWDGSLRVGPAPFITGHEPCGVIEEMNGTRLDIFGNPVNVGDRVVWSYVSCGQCYWCTVALQPCLCGDFLFWGRNPVEQFPHLLGSCSEYMYVPAKSHLVKVPEVVSSATAAASACAYRTVMHGFERLGAVRAHESIVIQGSGPLGIFAAAVAKESGLKQVLVIGGPQARLEAAKVMGAGAVLNIDEVTEPDGRIKWVRDNTDGRGADILMQVANNGAVPEGLRMLRRGGRYVNIGAGGDAQVAVSEIPHEISFYTVRSAEPRHWLQAIDFLASRSQSYPFDQMITRTYRLDDINDAMQAMGNYEVVKAAIDPKL